MDIEIEQVNEEPWMFEVALREGDLNIGDHVVTVTAEEYERYGIDMEPFELIEATFRFLLEREDPDMILEQFDLKEVEKYFPEYPDRVADYTRFIM